MDCSTEKDFYSLLSSAEVIRVDARNVGIAGLSYLPGAIKPGWVFVACDLPWLKGREYLNEVAQQGAAAVVVEAGTVLPASITCPTAEVPDSKKAYGLMCADFFSNPGRQLSLYGITGTKGKTTVCHILEKILTHAGARTGLISTIHRKIGDQEIESDLTTPDPFTLHSLLTRMRNAGVTHVVLEVSSIGLSEERIWGLRFEGVAFTNLGQDHLEYHGGLDNYKTAKSRLFTDFSAARMLHPICAINVDDDFGMQLMRVAKGDVITYGLRTGDIVPTDVICTGNGLAGKLFGIPFESGLLGRHNIYNLVCAAALAYGSGIDTNTIVKGINSLVTIPGRMERITDEHNIPVYIDYAHTPESVVAALRDIQTLNPRKSLVVIVGCGGGTDRCKRPQIAQAAIAAADVCIFTSDNPRWEDPRHIISEMISGLGPQTGNHSGKFEIVTDRTEAIMRGVRLAEMNRGAVAILGKGHERFQELRGVRLPFSDRQVALSSLCPQVNAGS